MISGSGLPREIDLQRFDTLFYETTWYAPLVQKHQRSYHAFGVDTDIMSPSEAERNIDWLMVGRPAAFKRPEAITDRVGSRLLIGEIYGAEEIVQRLRSRGVEVRDFVSYSELANIYQRTHTLLVAAELHGGGERAVLEARACGARVEISHANPKLQSVLAGPVYDHRYYAQQLLSGIERTIDDRGVLVESTAGHSFRRLLGDKISSLPNAVRWHWGRIARRRR